MTQPIVRLAAENIAKKFGGVVALDGVSVDFRAGEVHAICGENGAGKSTLMRILSGTIRDYTGELKLDGKPISFADSRAAEDAGVAIVHQELLLAPHLSATANIFLGREKTFAGFWLRDRAMDREAKRLLARLNARFAARTLVRDLRIGDRQLVEIAKALAADASVLILDEPTSALAAAEIDRLFKIINDLREHDVAIAYISHKMDEIFRLADRITVLRDGKWIATEDRNAVTPSDVIRKMIGRDWSPTARKSTNAAGDMLLSVERLTRSHPSRRDANVIENISFSIRAGEILGIAGLLGAGRTELLECLVGSASPSPTGKISLSGKQVSLRDPRSALQLGVGFVPEDRKRLGLLSGRDVRENASLCRLDELTTAGFIRSREEKALVEELTKRLNLKTPSLWTSVEKLSGGNQQKCVLARRLLARPRLLLLDEPTRGIDIGAKSEIYGILKTLAENGIAIIMASSELPELTSVCDRILVLCEGRLTGEFTAADATEEKLMRAMVDFRGIRTR